MIKSLLNSVTSLRSSLFICIFALSFPVWSDTAEDYEKALTTFNQEAFKESYIHLKNALQKSPEHLPSKLLMGRILLIDGYPYDAIAEFDDVIAAGADINLVIIPLANAYLVSGQYEKIVELTMPKNASQATQSELTLLKANAYMQQRNYAQAEQQFMHAKERFGNDNNVLNGLAQLALINKDTNKARQLIKQALQLNSNDAQSKLISGLIYQAENKHDQAMAEFETAYQLSSSDPAIKRALANSYTQAGKLEEANKLVSEVEKQSPNDLQTKLLKARILAMSEKNKEADIVLAELSQTLSLVSEETKQRLSGMSLVAGLTAHINGNYDISVRELSRYISNKTPSAQLIAILAEGYIRVGNNKMAVQTLERYEALIIENIQVSSLLCDLYLASHKVFKCDTLVQQLKQYHGDITEVLLLEAKLLYQRKLPNDALKILQTKLADTDDINVILFRANLLANLGQFEQAQKDAQHLSNNSPDNLAYQNLNADLYIRLFDFDKATELIDKVLREDPDNMAALVHRSRVLFAKSDLSGALASIQKVLEQDKGNPTALLLSGQVLVKLNRLDDAITNLIAAKTIDASNPSPRELLVSVYKQQERRELAISELDQLLKIRLLEPEYMLEKAKLYLGLEQPEKAQNQLNILYGQWTEQPEKLVELSRLQLTSQDIIGAEASLKRAQEVAPEYLLAQLEYANLLLQKKDYTQAKSHINKMDKSFPNNANVSLIMGQYYKSTGDMERAYRFYMKALSIAPDYTAALMELYQLATAGIHNKDIENQLSQRVTTAPEAHFERHLLADLFYLNGDTSAASQHYEKLIQVEDLPNKANIYNNLANILSNTNAEKALHYAEQAVKLNPGSSSILDTHGWLLTLNNDPQQGLNILRQAFTLKSNDPSIRYHLAYTLSKLGRDQEAKNELTLALRSGQSFPEQRAAQELLDKI